MLLWIDYDYHKIMNLVFFVNYVNFRSLSMRLTLFIEVATEALEEFIYPDEEIVAAYKPELAIVSAPTILLTLEAGVGNKTLPMLLLHVGFQSNISDWSTKSVSC